MIVGCWDWIVPGKTFQEKFGNLEKYGLSGIEIALPGNQNLKKAEDDIKKAVKNSNVRIAQVMILGKASGQTITDQSIKEAKVNLTKKAIEMTASVRGDFCLILPEHKAQLVLPSEPLEIPTSEEEKFFLQFLDEVAEYGGKFGITIVIEPINRYETHFYHSPLETMKVCQKVGRENVKTVADFFHMNIEEVSITKTIEKAKDYIYHVHLTDSNRSLPGKGHIDWEAGIATLKKVGYDRFLSTESHPLSNPEVELPQYAKYVKDLWEKS